MSRRRRRGKGGAGLEYDIPFTSVATLDELLRDVLIPAVGLPAIGMAWGAGDANAPRIWAGAENTTDILSLGGVVAPGHTPWRDSDGTAVASEEYATGASRLTATLVPILAAEDAVYVGVMRGVMPALQNYFFGTYDMTKGILVYAGAGVAYCAIQNDLGALGQTSIAEPTSRLRIFVAVVQRGANVTVVMNGIVGTPAVCVVGDITGAGLAINGSVTGINKNSSGHILHVLAKGAGIAAPFVANTFALPKEICKKLAGVDRRLGSTATFTRASAASWLDSTGRLAIATSGLPRAGDTGGLRDAPERTNKFYNTISPVATTGWSATGGTHSHSVDDSAALATAQLEAAGPYVHRFVPGAGDEVVYGGAATGGTDVHSLSCYLRGAAGGETVVLGLRDASSGDVQVGATLTLTTAWVRYYAQGITPADIDQVGALDCDAGDTVYFTLPQLEAGARATSPIPNWATAAAAVRAAETLDTAWTPSDVAGAVEATITPLGWADTEAGDSLILDRATGTGELLRADAAGGLCSDDGTTEARDTTTALADGVAVDATVAWGGTLDLEVDGTRTVVAYDGALQGSGVLRIEASLGEVAVRDVRCYRRRR